jgi:hypothetical protein
MRFGRSLALAIATVGLPLLSACAARGPSGLVQRVETLLGGPASTALILGTTKPDTRVAFRIDGTSERDGKPGERIHLWRVLGGPIPVGDAAAQRIATVLSDDGTYDWERAKACEFSPGVVVRYTSGTDTTDVLFCFACEELAIYRNDARVGQEDFDNARDELASVMKSLFPDDPAIQGL